MTNKLQAEWEKEAVGKNVHSVYVNCFNCGSNGINLPLERKCGNCGSMETTTYYDRETISIIVEKAEERAREELESVRVILNETIKRESKSSFHGNRVRSDLGEAVKILEQLSKQTLPSSGQAQMIMCKHCGEPIATRNKSGFCDHLYYPENCKNCRERKWKGE